jgi:DNA polymerase III delta prime subunit
VALQLEKYRPSTVEEIVGNVDAVSRLQVISHQGNMPNLILAGPPGTGKTTSILAMARGLLGAAAMKEAVLELNASDDRGIDVVRNRIKMFAQKKVTLPPGRHKIVLLDEADRHGPCHRVACVQDTDFRDVTFTLSLLFCNSVKAISSASCIMFTTCAVLWSCLCNLLLHLVVQFVGELQLLELRGNVFDRSACTVPSDIERP